MRPADAPDWADDHDFDIDLGDDHYAHFLSSGGEGVTNARTGEPVPYVEKAAVLVTHRQPNFPSGWCQGVATFKRFPEDRGWDVKSFDPLTLEPSLLCRVTVGVSGGRTVECNDHGFIRDGKWQRA